MNRPDNPAQVPRLGDLEAEALAVLAKIDPGRVGFLNLKGEWAENPETLRDRISHHLLFYLRSLNEKDRTSFFARTLSPFLTADGWQAVTKLAASREVAPASAFPAVLEALFSVFEREALKTNAGLPVAEWDSAGRTFRSESRDRQLALERSQAGSLSAAEWRAFQEASAVAVLSAGKELAPLARLIAEEEGHSAALEKLIAVSMDPKRREEAYSLILERIQPPQGIVTQIPPALFLPCLKLLLDRRIETDSGIPYLSSLVLSVFRDTRSAASILEALARYPLTFTKIRENLIYVLGQLKESRAVDALIAVLEAPDEVRETEAGRPVVCLLLEQKEEAIWALGKIGLPGVKAVPALARYTDHPSAKLRAYLAWTLGEVGRAQKEATGGVSADIVISLLKLLKEKNKQTFEEAVAALKKIDLPEFVHSLYLYHVGAVSILGLKPAQRGLYELSETLHYLRQTKKTTVMAVNGDSGTGKTYFCQAIAEGFADIRPEEILYLMRDSKRGQKVFNRLLGLSWLKKHIDPCYYQDYPVSEEEDDPEGYLRRFLEENSEKRLIILDGCRDRHYFQKVIDFFYLQGKLDVEVNFRATFSTRRLNLESREFALESVKLHLQFLEEPALEDTSFYQEGLVILFDLDNSIASRLDREETRELFERPRVDSWGELIRMGDFRGETISAPCSEGRLEIEEKDLEVREEAWPDVRVTAFTPVEMRLKPVLNEDLRFEPNLLKTIPLPGFRPDRLRFYAQDQVAGCGEDGQVFILTFLDNRIFQTGLEGISGFALLGRTLLLAVPGRGLLSLSFERDELQEWLGGDAYPQRVAVHPPDRFITAHRDGTIRIWDSLEKKVSAFAGGLSSLTSLAVDQAGRVYGGDSRGRLRQWDMMTGTAREVGGLSGAMRMLRYYPYGKILAAVEGYGGDQSSRLEIMDLSSRTSRSISLPDGRTVNGLNVYHDGRIIAATSEGTGDRQGMGKNLFVLSPGDRDCHLLPLSGHPGGTRDCLTMGPKIITCGPEFDGAASLRIWGSEFFVRTELGKLFIKP